MKVRTLSRLRIDKKFYLGDKVIDLPQSVVDELPPGTVEPVRQADEANTAGEGKGEVKGKGKK